MGNRVNQKRCPTCGHDLIDWSDIWNPFRDTVQKAPFCTTCAAKIEEDMCRKLYELTGKIKTRRK